MLRERKLMVVLGLLFFVGVTILVLATRGSPDRSSVPSTYSVHPKGLKALYLTLQELGVPVKRFRRTLSRLGSEQGVLVMVDPRRAPFGSRETKKLKQWIKKGNRLILFQGPGRKKPKKPDEKAEKKKGRTPWEGRFDPIAHKFGLKIKRTEEAGRETLAVSIPGLEGAGPISVSRIARWSDTPDDWTRLAGDDRGPVLLIKEMGEGSVVALCDPTLPSNRYLKREHNLRLVLALLLNGGKPAAVLFDEYHHGHALSDSLAGYLNSSVFSWIMLQIMVGAALFFYSRRARQSGRYRSLALPKGRSSLEYVDSMAHIFESCKASSVALEAILSRFIGRLSRSSGVSRLRLDDGSIDKIRVRAPAESGDVTGLVRDCRQALAAPDTTEGADPDKALALARRLGLVLKEMNRVRPGRNPGER